VSGNLEEDEGRLSTSGTCPLTPRLSPALGRGEPKSIFAAESINRFSMELTKANLISLPGS